MGHSHSAKLTPVSDRVGVKVQICTVAMFDSAARYQVTHAPASKETLQFDGTDLNFLARVLFAEASGSLSVRDASIRVSEKSAIIHVLYNRINVAGFDPNDYVHGKYLTFKGVASAVKAYPDGHLTGVQFASVVGSDGNGTAKFKSVDGHAHESLNKADCTDFNDCFDAIRTFLSSGPDPSLNYDNFRAAGSGPVPAGQAVIGGNRFWKMK